MVINECSPTLKVTENNENSHSFGNYVDFQFMFKKSLENYLYTEIVPNFGIFDTYVNRFIQDCFQNQLGYILTQL